MKTRYTLLSETARDTASPSQKNANKHAQTFQHPLNLLQTSIKMNNQPSKSLLKSLPEYLLARDLLGLDSLFAKSRRQGTQEALEIALKKELSTHENGEDFLRKVWALFAGGQPGEFLVLLKEEFGYAYHLWFVEGDAHVVENWWENVDPKQGKDGALFFWVGSEGWIGRRIRTSRSQPHIAELWHRLDNLNIFHRAHAHGECDSYLERPSKLIEPPFGWLYLNRWYPDHQGDAERQWKKACDEILSGISNFFQHGCEKNIDQIKEHFNILWPELITLRKTGWAVENIDLEININPEKTKKTLICLNLLTCWSGLQEFTSLSITYPDKLDLEPSLLQAIFRLLRSKKLAVQKISLAYFSPHKETIPSSWITALATSPAAKTLEEFEINYESYHHHKSKKLAELIEAGHFPSLR